MSETYLKEEEIDSLRKTWEFEDHWRLRRDFLMIHREKFPKNRLLSLAQMFVNIETLGTTYDEVLMKHIAELSAEVDSVVQWRESRKKLGTSEQFKTPAKKKESTSDYYGSGPKRGRWDNSPSYSPSFQRRNDWSPYRGYASSSNDPSPTSSPDNSPSSSPERSRRFDPRQASAKPSDSYLPGSSSYQGSSNRNQYQPQRPYNNRPRGGNPMIPRPQPASNIFQKVQQRHSAESTQAYYGHQSQGTSQPYYGYQSSSVTQPYYGTQQQQPYYSSYQTQPQQNYNVGAGTSWNARNDVPSYETASYAESKRATTDRR